MNLRIHQLVRVRVRFRVRALPGAKVGLPPVKESASERWMYRSKNLVRVRGRGRGRVRLRVRVRSKSLPPRDAAGERSVQGGA